MGKWLSILVGLILAALGLAGIIGWWSEGVWSFIRSGVVLAAFFVGIGAIVFGIGELRAPAETPPVTPPEPPADC
ncbi:MAG: hypothetical protein GTO55_06595 [Armatimonadetes bacterium]|nr:hypothetical protein [Armatimonadota bacterium]NIM23951.1 hypothetical protein [Armatimonadota bacterium]NIM67798.1 hypothetical protein [Armatimonadota bacterium]NIM76338.1 hypothetical protein [Armatimonadota bacterium]NIN06032.1 hypothetical protein [Armatimonadota bacterium]